MPGSRYGKRSVIRRSCMSKALMKARITDVSNVLPSALGLHRVGKSCEGAMCKTLWRNVCDNGDLAALAVAPD